MRQPLIYPNLQIDQSVEISGKKALAFLAWYKKQLDPFLNSFFTEKIKSAAAIHPEIVVLVEEIRRFVQNGGKRVRPAFTYAGYTAVGGRSVEAILYASAALEMTHAFALIHDDIIDRSDLRRGNLSVHKVFEEFHRKRNLNGASSHFGLSSAILAGDLALSWADELMNSAPFPSERIRAAKNYFDFNKEQVIFGQYLDLVFSVKNEVSEKDVLKVLEYKTSKYTVERPLHIGAVLAGAAPSTLETLSKYAVPMGQAFQIQDDIISTFGDATQSGKSTDSDFKEGKKTLLVIKALEYSNSTEKKRLGKILGNPKASNSDIETAKEIISNCGSLDYSKNLAKKLIESAKKSLYDERLKNEGKNYLIAAADYLLSRPL